jgi:hypothetical protein
MMMDEPFLITIIRYLPVIVAALIVAAFELYFAHSKNAGKK